MFNKDYKITKEYIKCLQNTISDLIDIMSIQFERIEELEKEIEEIKKADLKKPTSDK